MKITQKLRQRLVELYGDAVNTLNDEQLGKKVAAAIKDGKLTAKEVETLLRADPPTKDSTPPKTKAGTSGKSLVAGASGGTNAGTDIRVKSPFERYDSTKKSATSKKTGLTLPLPSQLEKAKMATFLKFSALKSGLDVNWTEHDQQMLEQMFISDRWQRVKGMHDEEEVSGKQAKFMLSQKTVRMQPFGTKAMLDDATSGGLELAPIYFDDLLTTYPVLNGELMPYVRITDIARGRRIESGALGNPTLNWGTAEGTAITPFTTTALASAIDRTIFNVTCAVEVGQDFLSDAGVDVGAALVENIGQKALETMDDVIASGDGTTQPLGIFDSSGFVGVTSDNGNPGPPTVADIESLYFAVPKQYRRADLNPRLIMNDLLYRRFRAIPVGPADERRVMGMAGEVGSGVAGLDGYSLCGLPVSINNNVILNTQAAMCCMKLYQLYRRLGTTFSWHQEGNYLAIRNLKLLVVRGRFGGGMRDAAGLSIMSDLQS